MNQLFLGYPFNRTHCKLRRRGLEKFGYVHDRHSQRAAQCLRPPLRRSGYRDPETRQFYVFLTNLFHLTAGEVAAIYKARWQIELFFKWVKQHLKIKSFLGTTANAVMTQLWVALCVYLLVAYVKFLRRPPGRL